MPNPWDEYKSNQTSGPYPWDEYAQPEVETAPVQQQAEQPTQPEMGIGEQLMRQLGLTARYIPQGLANTAGIVTNPITYGLNKLTGSNNPGIPQEVERLLDAAGLPKPETWLEGIVGSATEGVAGAGGTVGLANKAAGYSAPYITKALTALPITQAGASAGSAAAGKVAQEQGYGVPVQIASGIVGGFAGGNLAGAGARVARLEPALTPKPKAPTAQDLRNKASAEYQHAKQLGGTLTPKAMDKFLDGINDIQVKDDIARQLGGKDFVAENLPVLEKMRGQPMTLQRATDIDQRLTELMDAETMFGKPTQNGRQILQMQNKLRETIENAGLDDVIGGTEGFDAIKNGRKLWQQSAKLRDVEAIIQRAQGMEQPATGLRTGFRTLLNNPNRMRGYTAEEKAAIKAASETGTVGNLFRAFGSGLVPIASGITGAAGGPVGAALAGASGFAVQQASKAIGANMQLSRAKAVEQLLSQLTPKQVNELPPETLARIMGSAIGQNQIAGNK